MEAAKKMPMAVSSCTRVWAWAHSMRTATSTAKPMPVNRGSTPSRNPRATPPKAECEMPTPMKAMRRSTTKLERAPQSRLTRIPAIRARWKNPRLNRSIILRFHHPVGNFAVEEVFDAAAEGAFQPQAAEGGGLVDVNPPVDADHVVHVAGHAPDIAGDHRHRQVT